MMRKPLHVRGEGSPWKEMMDEARPEVMTKINAQDEKRNA